MKVWLIMSGEMIPYTNVRACRTGMLADALVQSGHQVTWWTTTFDHQEKRYLYDTDATDRLDNGVELRFLHAKQPYRRNLSWQRILNHRQVGKRFAVVSAGMEKPDLIFCSFPTIDLSLEAVRYGERQSIPVVLDVRDLWPDLFYTPFPAWMRPLLRMVLSGYERLTRMAFEGCAAVTAVSEGYLNWGLSKGNRLRTPLDRVFPLGFAPAEKSATDATVLQSFGIDASRFIVWFVGTFGRTYDLNPVIDCARRLSEAGRDEFLFVLTGDGEKSKAWKSRAEGLSNVVFTGWVGKEELNQISSIASVGLMAYGKDATQGLPNKLFEYLSAGLPILSSLEGETLRELEDYSLGLHYAAGDSTAFEAALLRLAESQDLQSEMRTNATKRFNDQYHSTRVYAALVEYLENFKKEC